MAKAAQMKRSIVISLAVHVLPILFMLLFAGGGSGKGDEQEQGGGNAKREGDITPKPNDKVDEPIEVGITFIKKAKPRPVTTHVDEPCEDFFGGIGIVHNPYTFVITSAPAGYPAANAGIRAGDRLVTDPETIRGEIGTEIQIIFANDEGIHSVTLIRDKICVNKVRH